MKNQLVEALKAAGENDYSLDRAEYLQQRLMSLGNIDTTSRIEDDLELRDRLTEAGNLIGTLLRRDSSLQDQLTQVRAELHDIEMDETRDPVWFQRTTKAEEALEAAEKREKALRDAARKLFNADGSMVSAAPGAYRELWRILERGEQMTMPAPNIRNDVECAVRDIQVGNTEEALKDLQRILDFTLPRLEAGELHYAPAQSEGEQE